MQEADGRSHVALSWGRGADQGHTEPRGHQELRMTQEEKTEQGGGFRLLPGLAGRQTAP